MSISISDDLNGRLVISGDPEVFLSLEVKDLLFPFSLVFRDGQHIVLDPGERSAEPIVYLINGFRNLGYEVKLTESIGSLYNGYQTEMDLMTDMIASAQKGVIPSEKAAISKLHEAAPSFSLLPHQVKNLSQLLAIRNAANFSVQGSGKTAVILAAFAIWREAGIVSKLFVIGPLSCFKPWEDEYKRCFGLKPISLRWTGSISRRTKLVPEFLRSELILCSYDTATRDENMLTNLLRKSSAFLVLDESHYIKNFEIGARAKAVIRLSPSAIRRAILTGTPAPHSLFDIWTQFTFLWPHTVNHVLGNRRQFQDLVEKSKSPAQELRKRLQPFFSRTNQSELGLPEPRILFPKIPERAIPKEQRRIINLLEVRIRSELRRLIDNEPNWQTMKEWRRARIIRLLQAASNPGLLVNRDFTLINTNVDVDISDLRRDASRFDRGEIIPAKISWTINKIKELVKKGSKVVVWTSWIGNIRLLNQLLSELNPLQLFGEIKPYLEGREDSDEETREKNILAFRTRKDRPVLIANPAACAEAISLHKECHNAIYLDRTFNCGQFLQSMNRIHRVGLPLGVKTTYWIPFLECAIERSVNSRLSSRQKVMFEFLGDTTPIVDIDEDNPVSDSDKELEDAFNCLVKELVSGEQGSGSVNPAS